MAPVYQEHRGKPLPVFWGCHVVGVGEVFVASPEETKSGWALFWHDARREGPKVVPVWTWR